MDIINYYPHDLNTRFHACITYSKRKDNHYKLKDILRLYHISKASLMRWMKRFDGTKESLKDKSKRPITPHPNSHTSDEIKNINNLLKRNPNIGLSELYGKLRRDYAYTRHPASLFRFLRKMGIYTIKEAEHNKYKINVDYLLYCFQIKKRFAGDDINITRGTILEETDLKVTLVIEMFYVMTVVVKTH